MRRGNGVDPWQEGVVGFRFASDCLKRIPLLRILIFPIPSSCSYFLYYIVEFNPHLILASALGPQTLCGGHHANCLGHFESNPSSPPDSGEGEGVLLHDGLVCATSFLVPHLAPHLSSDWFCDSE
jgi:hypothetical protein